jgi:hypothetical protein
MEFRTRPKWRVLNDLIDRLETLPANDPERRRLNNSQPARRSRPFPARRPLCRRYWARRQRLGFGEINRPLNHERASDQLFGRYCHLG